MQYRLRNQFGAPQGRRRGAAGAPQGRVTLAVLKQAKLCMSVADATRQFGVSEQRLCRWKRSGNSRLKCLVADLSLDKAILQDINAKKWPGPR